LATYPVGGSVRLEVLRRGEARTVTLGLQAPPEVPPRQMTLLRGRHALAGATVANLSPALATELDTDPTRQGVIVLEVARRSPAARLRLKAGDVVLRVNDRDTDNVDALKAVLAGPEFAGWRIAVRRGDKVLKVTVGG
jgi:serine protease Do